MVSRVPSSRPIVARRRRAPHRIWRTFAAVFGVVGLGLGGWQLWSYVHAHRVTLTFGDAPPTGVELTFFPEQLAFAAPSPPPPIGSLALVAATDVTVGEDLVPGQAVVRYAAAGAGTGYRHLRLGEDPAPIELRAPGTLRGRVVEPIALWSLGWRCAELRPVADAEVVVMGGGEHGVELASARTDAAGEFVVGGFDRELDGLGVRVRAAGFALEHQSLGRSAGRQDAVPVVALARAGALSGRIIAPPSFDVRTLRVLARGLPGVEAVPAADGAFVLEHVPPGVRPRLVLYGLPTTLAHAPARAQSDVRIELVAAASVRGRVVDAATRAPLGGALVFGGDDQAVRADASGRFELARLPPGPATIEAKFEFRERRRRVTRTGSCAVDLRAGEQLTEVLVPVD
jgi:hypothetical protein